MTDADDYAISYKVLKPGTPVKSADGIELGKVRGVEEAKREQIFDGIVVDTAEGQKFIDAPEVARITEQAVTVTFDAADLAKFAREPRKSAPILNRAKRMWSS